MAAGARPAGVVTFLFTDVEGSTRRWENDAPAMRLTLAAHDEVLRTAVAHHDGFLFKHTGDGICAAFASPRAAVDAAIDAQRAVQLPVRMGIATGEAEARGDDYFGPALNRAARVMAAGHGGQILVADSAATLLDGVDLVDLGPRRLRDLATPVGLFQVRGDGLPAEFPPLRTVEASRGNLRPPHTSFVGRDTEIGDVIATMRNYRLVTLTGVGGVGKTRLALEVAARMAAEFPDGTWNFELASVSDAGAVPDAVAAVLGVTPQPNKTMIDSVAAALDGRLRLLVLDNCEHLLDAVADLVETVLAASSTVRILATSREGLGIAEEQVRPVRSLDVKAGIDSAAVALFSDRARSLSPDFSTGTPSAAAAVVEICRRLDGIPLAIELAASRVASMTVTEVRDRLDQRFQLLVGSRRGLERHQTLHHAVAWSYDLLDSGERRLLQCCSTFAGGFDLQSASAVCGFVDPDSSDTYTVLNLLDALVRKSLVVADGSSGRTRFSMLETIRQFAEDQLTATGDAVAVRCAHAGHFADQETRILALWDSPGQRDAYDWFSTELPNLRTAFRWAADHNDLNVAAAIVTYATVLCLGVGNYEISTWAEDLVESARTADHPRLAHLYLMSSQCWVTGRVEDAIRYSDAGQIVVDGGGDVAFGGAGWLGGAYQAAGQPERMVELCRTYLERGRDSHALTRAALVVALTSAGSPDEARSATTDMLTVAEATQNPYAVSFALLAYGYAFRDADPPGALAALRRGLSIAEDSGNRWNASHLSINLSRVEATHGDPLAAIDHIGAALHNYHDAGNTNLVRTALAILAAPLDRLGRHEQAATVCGFAFGALAMTAVPEINDTIAHLRGLLGDAAYESRAQDGAAMTATQVVAYADEQIDLARANLTSS